MKSIIIFLLLSANLAAQYNPGIIKDIIYARAGGKELKLDLYLPGNDSSFLVIWIHGGAWHSGNKEDPPGYLLKKGYALASLEYRLSVDAPFPAMIHDIKAAVRFLRGNAEIYGYNKDKIAVWGSSAGGHLAALIGTTNKVSELEGNSGNHQNESSSVQAIIDFYGPANLLTILGQSTPYGLSVRAPALALLLGKPAEQAEEAAKLASPVYQVDQSDPPLLILHGDQDNQVPVNQSLELKAAYDAAGLDAELIIVHGAGHSDPVYFQEKYMKIAETFLERVLKN